MPLLDCVGVINFTQRLWPVLAHRWQRIEDVKEAAEEAQRKSKGAADGVRASTLQAAAPPAAALSVEEKLASRRQIFAPREAYGRAAASCWRSAAL